MKVSGGCHCGAVRFSADVAEDAKLLDCNCSICSKTGFLHLIVPQADFVIERGEAVLSSYRFGTRAADHMFCSVCGVKPFYRPRSHPDAWSVNFRCLDAGHGLAPKVTPFDGQNWESARSSLQD